jgi:hypothetical protein
MKKWWTAYAYGAASPLVTKILSFGSIAACACVAIFLLSAVEIANAKGGSPSFYLNSFSYREGAPVTNGPDTICRPSIGRPRKRVPARHLYGRRLVSAPSHDCAGKLPRVAIDPDWGRHPAVAVRTLGHCQQPLHKRLSCNTIRQFLGRMRELLLVCHNEMEEVSWSVTTRWKKSCCCCYFGLNLESWLGGAAE